MSPDTDGDRNAVDYSAVEIPADADPEDYHYTQRRAEILTIIRKRGHPGAVRQEQLAERYDVSPGQISQDMDRLADHVSEAVGDRKARALLVDSVIQRSIRELQEAGDHRAAVKSVLEYAEWAQAHTDLAELEERLEAIEAGETTPGAPTPGLSEQFTD